MLKVEDKRTYIGGTGDDLLVEYAMMTHSLKMVLMKHYDDDDAAEYADYLLFTAFKYGLDAPEDSAKFVDEEKKADEKEDKWLKMLDDLIDSIKGKGD